ncbi:ABC transporter ATP-binding protein [Kitasatospora sp. NBC_00070]|uniref:ABC transporter ATP-binding protein n=1 Tax=Kitasatospora sp. NBC_00070 TaxID=2975962 RepID=UPI0032486CE6
MNHPTDSQSAHGGLALAAVGLGLRRRDGWALRNCDFELPVGRVCGVVGPNGAGKSTLLALGARLLTPTEGELRVLGEAGDTPELRPRIGFVAQDRPLYPGFTVAETLRLGRELNPRWDQDLAQRIVDQGELRGKARIGSLSGGQRTRVALALALGKRPELLLLDEPMADLDPLARHQLMGALMAAAAEHGTTVVLSSHVLAELDGVIDHLLLVRSGRVVLAGDPDELLDDHRLLTGGGDLAQLAGHTVVESRSTGRRTTALVRTGAPVTDAWESDRPSLEDLLLGYLRSPSTDADTTTHSKAAA